MKLAIFAASVSQPCPALPWSYLFCFSKRDLSQLEGKNLRPITREFNRTIARYSFIQLGELELGRAEELVHVFTRFIRIRTRFLSPDRPLSHRSLWMQRQIRDFWRISVPIYTFFFDYASEDSIDIQLFIKLSLKHKNAIISNSSSKGKNSDKNLS